MQCEFCRGYKVFDRQEPLNMHQARIHPFELNVRLKQEGGWTPIHLCPGCVGKGRVLPGHPKDGRIRQCGQGHRWNHYGLILPIHIGRRGSRRRTRGGRTHQTRTSPKRRVPGFKEPDPEKLGG